LAEISISSTGELAPWRSCSPSSAAARPSSLLCASLLHPWHPEIPAELPAHGVHSSVPCCRNSLVHSAPSSSLLPWRPPVEAPCRHPLFLLSLPVPSPKQQAPAPPTSPMENSKPPRCPGVLAAQLGLASLLSGQPSHCSTTRTTCSTICATDCVWSCWCFAQRLRDATDLRSAYELSSKPAVSSLLPRAFCVRLEGRTNKSHNKLCNDCVCRLIAALVDVTPCASLVGKEPKQMACMRGTSRPGCSPCMIAIYFTYGFGR
jgi:hypothetical protein